MDSNRVLEIFEEITRIPRESGHEELIIAFLQNFAAVHSLECRTDEVGNVVIVKPASPGKEDVPTIVLQSHSDMVCEKNSDVDHDFTKDPIRYEFRDGWMVAPDTTLGADCGIGIAAELAILESGQPTGRIECLFTVSEETGLDGANALQPGFISGKTLVNLDSEDEGELFVGCAGGLDTTAVFDADYQKTGTGVLCEFEVSGGLGGHSGDDIDKGRANAIKVLVEFIHKYAGRYRLVDIAGGNKRNAIARSAKAVLVADGDEVYADMEAAFAEYAEKTKEQYCTSDPSLEFRCSRLSAAVYPESLDKESTARLVEGLYEVPHGVLAMSRDIPGLVETSTNLASIHLHGNDGDRYFRIGTSQRSSIDSDRRNAGDRVSGCFERAGMKVSHENEYPGWKPNMDSHILDVTRNAYKELFGVDPVVRAIHAGLECGLFLEKFPGLDMISFGPTLRGVHAPGERLELASLDKFVKLLDKVIDDLS